MAQALHNGKETSDRNGIPPTTTSDHASSHDDVISASDNGNDVEWFSVPEDRDDDMGALTRPGQIETPIRHKSHYRPRTPAMRRSSYVMNTGAGANIINRSTVIRLLGDVHAKERMQPLREGSENFGEIGGSHFKATHEIYLDFTYGGHVPLHRVGQFGRQ